MNDGVADSALKGLMPDIDFSAALPGSWTVTNLQTNGGCGGTGASRASIVCYNGGLATVAMNSATSDTSVPRASLSIASYSSGAYTMQMRFKQISQEGDSNLTVTNPPLCGLRNGTADNSPRITLSLAASGTVVLPFTSSNHSSVYFTERTTVAGAAGATYAGNVWPEADAMPFYVRFVRRGATVNFYTSADGVNWEMGMASACSGSTNTNAGCSLSTSSGSSSMDHVEIPYGMSYSAQSASNGPWIEVDQFTMQTN